MDVRPQALVAATAGFVALATVTAGTARVPGVPLGLKSGRSKLPPTESASCPFMTVKGTPLSTVRHAGNLPAADHFADETALVLVEGQLVRVGEHRAVCTIEQRHGAFQALAEAKYRRS